LHTRRSAVPAASAAVTPNGAGNYLGILQFGGTATASVAQSGTTNFSFVGQSSGIPTMAFSPLNNVKP